MSEPRVCKRCGGTGGDDGFDQNGEPTHARTFCPACNGTGDEPAPTRPAVGDDVELIDLLRRSAKGRRLETHDGSPLADLIDRAADRIAALSSLPDMQSAAAGDEVAQAIKNARENVEVRRKVGDDCVWLSCYTVETLLAALSPDMQEVERLREALERIAEEGDAEINAARLLEGCREIAREALKGQLTRGERKRPQQGTEEQPWCDPMPETPMPDGPQ
jgi:hypothetical protein